MRTASIAIAALSTALCLAHAPAAAAAKAGATDPVYAVDLRAFLDSMNVYKKSMAALPSNSADRAEREFVAAFAAAMTPDQFYAKAMPVFARYIPPEQAHTLGEMARKRPVALGKQGAAMQAYWAMEKQAGPDLVPVWKGLASDFFKRIDARAVAEIRRSAADLADHRGTGYTVKVNPVGLPSLDRVVWLTVQNFVRTTNSTLQAERSCQHFNGKDTFAPAALVSDSGLAAARQAIDECERGMEASEREDDASFKEFQNGMLALEFMNKNVLVRQIDKQAHQHFEFNVKLGEMTRQLLEEHRQLTRLTEAKRARIHVTDDKLQFETEEDLAEFRRIATGIETLQASVNDYIYRTRQAGLLHDIDMHDDVKPPEEAARTAD